MITVQSRQIARSLTTARSSLVFDPFADDHTKKIRETHTQFPIPHLVSFDVFGTVYAPKKPVPEQYHAISLQEFGISKPLAEIQQDFASTYAQLMQKYPNWGKGVLPSCDAWWLELMVAVFQLPHYSKDEQSKKFCDRLLQHFTTDEAYRVFDDVVPTLQKLAAHKVRVIACSNSDIRVHQTLDNLGLGKYFSGVFTSYEIGSQKPDRAFFDAVASATWNESKVPKRSAFLEGCWHVGDSREHDFLGPIRAGWNGVLLDRERLSQFFSGKGQVQPNSDHCYMSATEPSGIQEDSIQVVANNRAAVTGLSPLLRIFGLL